MSYGTGTELLAGTVAVVETGSPRAAAVSVVRTWSMTTTCCSTLDALAIKIEPLTSSDVVDVLFETDQLYVVATDRTPLAVFETEIPESQSCVTGVASPCATTSLPE